MKRYGHAWLTASIIAPVTLLADASLARQPPTMPLQPITAADWRSGGVGGTGCWWRAQGDGRWRFAMSDNHAVAKIAGVVVTFSPAAGAKDVFPFTFDSWRGDGVSVRIQLGRAGRRTGSETLTRPARLIVTTGGDRRVFSGAMVCGS